MNFAKITLCFDHPDFAAFRMKIFGAHSAVALPSPVVDMFTPVITDLVARAHSTRGSLLRDAVQEALLLFTTLVLGPQSTGVSSSSVKT